MLFRAAIVAASVLMAGQALAADTKKFAPVENGVITRPLAAPAPQVVIAPPGFGELTNAPSELHAQELKRIAVYAAIGNRDGAEILSTRLRQFGVTRDEVQSAIDETHVHGDTARGAPQIRQSWFPSDDNATVRVSY